MNAVNFGEASAAGKVAYLILCAEQYALCLKPSQDWRPLFVKMWQPMRATCWDFWSDEFLEYLPEFLYEFDEYERADFEFITLADFEYLREMHAEMPPAWNELLDAVRTAALEFGYDPDDPSREGQKAAGVVLGLLRKAGVDLPSVAPCEISPSASRGGYGDPLEPEDFSSILCDADGATA